MMNRSMTRICSVGAMLLGGAACGPELQEEPGDGTVEGAGGAGGSGHEGGAGGEEGGAGGANVESPLTVRAVDAATGDAIADVVIVVSNNDGSLSSSSKTGADGEAEVLIPEGGFVSTLWRHEELTTLFEPALRTVHEVRSFYPAADLGSLEVSLQADDFVPDAPMSITFDVAPIEGVSEYSLVLSCGVTGFVGGTSGTATLHGYWGCPGQATFGAMLIARGDDGLVDVAVRQDVAFVAGTEATLAFSFGDAPMATVDFTADGAFGDELQIGLLSGGNDLGLAPGAEDGALLEPAPSHVERTLKAPVGIGTSYCHSIQWTDNPPGGDVVGELRRGCDEEVPDSVVFEGGRLAMPAIEASATKVSFTLGDAGELGDGLELQALQGDEGATWRWRASRAALATGSFTFPELPAGAASFEPGAGPTSVSLSNVDVLDRTDGFVSAMARSRGGLGGLRETIEVSFTSAFLP